ncbi:hypothetical protein FRB90_001040 [Tulasnella sp. 427]|nr:hypothetical protein FRB90_001040 [Tulasnella sp. 427]
MAIFSFKRRPKTEVKVEEGEKSKKDVPQEKPAELGVVAEFELAAEKCREKVKKLAVECHKQNRKFRDPDFDLVCDRWLCLHNFDRRPGSYFDPDDVRRVTDIFAYPKFFDDGATASDICQGALGDCWFLSALGTVAAIGQIPRMCIERDEAAGIYGFVFWRDCAWVEVIIDDLLYTRVPPWETLSPREKAIYQDNKDLYSRTARKGGKNLLFARSATENETWLPLLEKAYAKLYGDYASLEGGWPCDGVEDLTGAIPTVLFTQDILDHEKFWKDDIMQVGRAGRILSCSTPESVLWKYDKPYYEGVVARHAYSITKAIEYDHRKFVVIRNPWGKFEWTGRWADGSKEWNGKWAAGLRKALGDYKFGDDGEFVQEYDDFLTTWKLIQLNRPFDESWIMSYKWLKVGWENDKSWSSNHASFSITLKNPTDAVLVLGKSDDTHYFSSDAGFAWGFSFTVHKKGSEKDKKADPIAQSAHSKMSWRSVNAECKLDEPGEYVVKVHIDREKKKDKEVDVKDVPERKLEQMRKQLALSRSLTHKQCKSLRWRLSADSDDDEPCTCAICTAEPDPKELILGLRVYTKKGSPVKIKGHLESDWF